VFDFSHRLVLQPNTLDALHISEPKLLQAQQQKVIVDCCELASLKQLVMVFGLSFFRRKRADSTTVVQQVLRGQQTFEERVDLLLALLSALLLFRARLIAHCHHFGSPIQQLRLHIGDLRVNASRLTPRLQERHLVLRQVQFLEH
jgi:hypothetical protein